MNGPLKYDFVKHARACLTSEQLSEQRPVLIRADVEDLGALLYRLSGDYGHDDAINSLVRWAALHTDALMSVLLDRVQKPIDTTTHVHPDSRIGVAAPEVPPALLSPLPEQAPPLPPAPPPIRLGNNEKRAALKAGGWTCHEDIEAQNVPVCWENGGKWVTLENAYDQLTAAPRASTLDEMVGEMLQVQTNIDKYAPPPPPPPEPYLTVRELRALLEGLPGDACVAANGVVIRRAEVDRLSDAHGIVLLTG